MIPPGLRVIVQVPADGSPLNSTLPVVITQVGCVMMPTVGVEGFAFTVNGIELLQPSDVLVYVKVTEPAATPVTTPALVMVAILLFEEAHVPFVEGVTMAVDPAQTSVAPPKAGAKGGVLITTSDEGTDVQEFVFVTLKV